MTPPVPDFAGHIRPFMQKQIIPQVFRKINPFLKKFSDFSPYFLHISFRGAVLSGTGNLRGFTGYWGFCTNFSPGNPFPPPRDMDFYRHFGTIRPFFSGNQPSGAVAVIRSSGRLRPGKRRRQPGFPQGAGKNSTAK